MFQAYINKALGKLLNNFYIIIIIIINLTPFEPKAMWVSYKILKTRENLATFVVG